MICSWFDLPPFLLFPSTVLESLMQLLCKIESMSQMSQVTQGCAQLVGSYKVVQKVHCVCASLSGAPMWWIDVQGVFRDTQRYKIHTFHLVCLSGATI